MAKQNTKGAKAKGTKKRKVNVEAVGEAHVSASFNNILVSLTNKKGDVISWSSAGKMGFRGSKKNTPYAAQLAAEDASKWLTRLVFARSRYLLKGQVTAASLQYALSTTVV